MYSSLLLTTGAAFFGLAAAQNYSTSGPLSIVASSVDANLRHSWCVSELSTCPDICGGQATQSCDADTLNYTCTCTSGTTPNISDYQNTIPFYVCQQWKIDCTAAHPNDLAGQTACQSVTCGQKNASTSSSSTTSAASGAAATSGSSSSSSAASASGSSTGTSTASSASSTSSKSAAMAISIGREYGTGIIAAGILAVFGFAL